MTNRMLAIDDEPDLLSVLERVAVRAGYEVAITSCAGEFQERLGNWNPSLILMDLQMPGQDGIELMRILAGRRCDAAIVLMSGLDPRVLATACALGREHGLDMGEPLSKPFGAAALEVLLQHHRHARSALSAETLAGAIGAGQLVLHFQPIVELASRQPLAVEALARWQHPRRGLIHPDAFVPLAERGGPIDALTDWVVEQSVKQLALWQAAGMRLQLSLNLSSANLADTGFPDRVRRWCTDAGISPELLQFELTESAAMSDQMRGLDVLTRLRIYGCRLSIDDFGTGYSSLLQLRRLPFTSIKVDKSFVADIGRSNDAEVIVRTIVSMAQNMGLQAVAEGIESEQVASFLSEAGCALGQGYLFSRPLPAASLTDYWLTRQARRE